MMNLLPGREYSYEELARLTKSSVRAVAGRLFRARARLRKLLRSHGADQ
jgi:DNA-directed RNA polymerase specialized sigma24 family protein